MVKNGWTFDTNYDQNDFYKSKCSAHNTWYGYKNPGDGSVSATFTGSGTLTLDFGNCYAKGGCVVVTLNKERKDIVYKNTPSKKVTFNFSPNDVLKLTETEGNAIIKLNSLKITCQGKLVFHPKK